MDKGDDVLIAIVLAVVLLIAGIAALAKRCEPEPPCVDYTRMISAFSLRKPELSCGPGMTMTVKEKVQGALVTCTCPKEKR